MRKQASVGSAIQSMSGGSIDIRSPSFNFFDRKRPSVLRLPLGSRLMERVSSALVDHEPTRL
jgi:hypothetical protein